MKDSIILVVTSLLAIVFMIVHLAQDILFKMASPGFPNLFAVAIFVVWLYGTLVLATRVAGYVIMFLGGLFGFGVAILHMRGAGGLVAGDVGRSSHAFLFICIALALAVTGAFSAVLSLRLLLKAPGFPSVIRWRSRTPAVLSSEDEHGSDLMPR